MSSFRSIALAGALVLAAGCASEKPAADTTGTVTTTATSDAQLADTALASTPGGANPAAATPRAASTPGAVPNGATGAAAAVPGTASGVVTAPGTTSPGATATDSAQRGAGTQVPAAAPATVSAAPQEPLAKPGLSAQLRPAIPYSTGERLVYDVKFSSVDVGDAVMEVLGLENVRGRQALHIRFNVKGGTLFYKVNDRYESWIDTLRLISLRHWQQIDEGSYERERRYEIMPEIGTYKENDKPEQPTVAEPLDDGSFFYFLRTIPLEVGKTYTFDRYFRPDRNPVTVTVVRRERITVPAGTFDAIVLHPTIKAKGIFGEGGQAEIWLTDDSSKIMLQMKSKLKIGSLNLYLKSIRRGGS
jgi:uncharacterized protein DUF3108